MAESIAPMLTGARPEVLEAEAAREMVKQSMKVPTNSTAQSAKAG